MAQIQLNPSVAAILAQRGECRDGSCLSYKLHPYGKFDGASQQYGMDSVYSTDPGVDESEMSFILHFADGSRRDGVGDLLNVEGIDTSRHRGNPLTLFDHGKQIALPIGFTETRDTKEYTVFVDPVARTAKAKVYVYDGRKGIDGEEREQVNAHALFCEQIFDMWAKRLIRAGSIGYQVIEAEELPQDWRRGIPKGLYLNKVLMLEASAVVLPANGDTVRKMLAMPKCCGKPLSPYLVKSLKPYAGRKTAQLGWEPGRVETKAITARHGDSHKGYTLKENAELGVWYIYSPDGRIWFKLSPDERFEWKQMVDDLIKKQQTKTLDKDDPKVVAAYNLGWDAGRANESASQNPFLDGTDPNRKTAWQLGYGDSNPSSVKSLLKDKHGTNVGVGDKVQYAGSLCNVVRSTDDKLIVKTQSGEQFTVDPSKVELKSLNAKVKTKGGLDSKRPYRVIGTLPATGQPYVVQDGVVWLVVGGRIGYSNMGEEEEFLKQVEAGKWRFRAKSLGQTGTKKGDVWELPKNFKPGDHMVDRRGKRQKIASVKPGDGDQVIITFESGDEWKGSGTTAVRTKAFTKAFDEAEFGRRIAGLGIQDLAKLRDSASRSGSPDDLRKVEMIQDLIDTRMGTKGTKDFNEPTFRRAIAGLSIEKLEQMWGTVRTQYTPDAHRKAEILEEEMDKKRGSGNLADTKSHDCGCGPSCGCDDCVEQYSSHSNKFGALNDVAGGDASIDEILPERERFADHLESPRVTHYDATMAADGRLSLKGIRKKYVKGRKALKELPVEDDKALTSDERGRLNEARQVLSKPPSYETIAGMSREQARNIVQELERKVGQPVRFGLRTTVRGKAMDPQVQAKIARVIVDSIRELDPNDSPEEAADEFVRDIKQRFNVSSEYAEQWRSMIITSIRKYRGKSFKTKTAQGNGAFGKEGRIKAVEQRGDGYWIVDELADVGPFESEDEAMKVHRMTWNRKKELSPLSETDDIPPARWRAGEGAVKKIEGKSEDSPSRTLPYRTPPHPTGPYPTLPHRTGLDGMTDNGQIIIRPGVGAIKDIRKKYGRQVKAMSALSEDRGGALRGPTKAAQPLGVTIDGQTVRWEQIKDKFGASVFDSIKEQLAQGKLSGQAWTDYDESSVKWSAKSLSAHHKSYDENDTPKEAYTNGKNDCHWGIGKDRNPYKNSNLKAQWLKGWHEYNAEIEQRYSKYDKEKSFQEIWVKSLPALRKKYKASTAKGLRRRLRKSQPGVSAMDVDEKDMDAAREMAEAKGIKFQRTGQTRVKLTGQDDAIDEVAKSFGVRVKHLGQIQTKGGMYLIFGGPNPHDRLMWIDGKWQDAMRVHWQSRDIVTRSEGQSIIDREKSKHPNWTFSLGELDSSD